MARNTIARIDADAVAHNLAQVRRWAPESRIMAVVKADAYGHRLDLCLPALAEADMLAVATIDEARAVRRLGNRQRVLLLEGVLHASDLAVVETLGLELTIHHASQVEMLEAFGRAPGPRLWLKVDSGMHRLGVEPEQARPLHARLLALPGAEQVNLVTHFASAESPLTDSASHQLARFDAAVTGLAGEHCLANSGAILNHPDTHRDWVRAGIMLYGVSPVAGRTGSELGLKPAMTVEAEVLAINRVGVGETIGYGGRFRAERDLTVAVIGIGYGDGYPRSVADGTPVWLGGQCCPLVGRVSMDMITVDVTDCPGVAMGDRAVLWGQDVPIEWIASAADTIPYELSCRLTRRVRYRSAHPGALDQGRNVREFRQVR